MKNLYPDPLSHDPSPKVVANTRYFDYIRDGVTLFTVKRIDFTNAPKKISQMSGGRYEIPPALKQEGSRPLYKLPELLQNPNAPVLVVEGEPHCDRLHPAIIAVSTSEGARKARYTDLGPLVGRTVVLCPDNDDAGRGHMEDIAQRLVALGQTADQIRWLVLDGLDPKGDVLDWLRNGHEVAELRDLMGDAPVWESDGNARPESGPLAALARNTDTKHWPTEWPLNDRGNAQRLVKRHADDLRFCHQTGNWLVWDGRRWAKDDTGEVMRRAKETARAIYEEIPLGSNDVEKDAIYKHAKSSENKTPLQNMITLAQSELPIPIVLDQLDQNPWRLNVLNGTLDLRNGHLYPHERTHFLTKLLPVEYDANATAPRWETFLSQIVGGDQILVTYLQRAIGYSLTDDMSEQVFFVLHGRGANGKSVFLDTLLSLFSDYGRRVSFETFVTQPYAASTTTNMAMIAGARFVTASESEEHHRLAESLIKDITGGEKSVGRLLYQNPFQFRPTAKIWLATNHKPQIRGSDHAIWRRVQLIPFTVTIPEDEQDRHLAQKLKNELPGILAWAVRGCLAWQKDGLQTPTAVRSATDAYREESDILGPFIAERCIVTREATASAKDLYAEYCTWCEDNRERAISQKAFGGRLTERGLEKQRSTGGRYIWLGIGLQTPESERSERSDPYLDKSAISSYTRSDTFMEKGSHGSHGSLSHLNRSENSQDDAWNDDASLLSITKVLGSVPTHTTIPDNLSRDLDKAREDQNWHELETALDRIRSWVRERATV
ncbi:MAG: phage/plasmid primase, P4 family [Sulfobacillus sp.]